MLKTKNWHMSLAELMSSQELSANRNDRLIETSLDQVIREMEGLRQVRDWHKVAGLPDQQR